MRIKLLFSLLFFLTMTFNVRSTQISFVTEYLPPYQMKQNHVVTGYATDIVKQMMTYTPYSYSIDIYPWSRAYNLALHRNNTCVFSIVKTPSRESKLKWIAPLINMKFSLIGLRDSNISINSLAEAKKYKIGVIRDDLSYQYLEQRGFTKNKNLFILNNTHSILKLLNERKFIDLIANDPFTIPYRAQFNHLDDKSFKTFFTLNNIGLKYYLACNNAMDNSIIEQFRAAFNQLTKDGKYQQINNYWQAKMKNSLN